MPTVYRDHHYRKQSLPSATKTKATITFLTCPPNLPQRVGEPHEVAATVKLVVPRRDQPEAASTDVVVMVTMLLMVIMVMMVLMVTMVMMVIMVTMVMMGTIQHPMVEESR